MASTTDDGHNVLSSYILTYTGQRVEGVGGEGSPNLTDVAVSAGRIPRFAGATSVWYPVLLHLFVVREIVEAMGGGPGAQLEALFHDAHEVLTGDVPSPFKPPEMSAFQRALDVRIRARLGVPEPSGQVAAMVKDADTVALLAEGHLVGPPGSEEWVRARGGFDQDAVEIVQGVLTTYPGYADTIAPDGAAVRDYMTRFEDLRGETE